MKYIDLHVHTNCSDGSFSPEAVVEYAAKINLSAIGITDHDTTEAVAKAELAGKKYNLEVIPGVELSVESPNRPGLELHILGYFLEYNNESFQERLSFFRQKRHERAQQILEKLHGMNIYIDGNKLIEKTNDNAIGRLHFAQALLEEGYVNNIQEAFQKYIGFGKPAYVPKARLSPAEAMAMITNVKGIPVLAHPYFAEINEDMIQQLVNLGLKGIEVYHCKHSLSDIGRFKHYANEFGLLMTGGSDCHGEIDKNEPLMGTMKVSYEILERMKEYKEKGT